MRTLLKIGFILASVFPDSGYPAYTGNWPAGNLCDLPLGLGSTVNGQSSKEGIKLDRAYWKNYLTDTRDILESPLHWRKFDFLEAGLITIATVGFYVKDREIKDWAQRNRNDNSNDIAVFAKPFGDGRYTLPPLAAFYLYGRLTNQVKPQQTALLSLESFVIAGLLTTAFQHLGHRHRPSTGDPYNRWEGPGFSNSNLSFPSGHATVAFAVLTVIASEYSDNDLIPPLAYGIATLTALSRVNDNQHWSSDVLFGSAIGFFTAKAIVRWHKVDKKGKFTIYPIFDNRYTGIAIVFRN